MINPKKSAGALDHIKKALPQVAPAVVAALLAVAPVVVFLASLSRSFRRTCVAGMPNILDERRWWIILLAMLPLVAFIVGHPAPPDDLLRDLHAWRLGFDYRGMFWGSPGVQAGDYYLGFDWLVGWIDRAGLAMGLASWTWAPVVGLNMLLWGAGFAAVLWRVRHPGNAAQMALWIGTILVAWLSPDFTQRILSGRPESFFALWALTAIAVEGVWGAALWVLVGTLMSTWYWFFWIYVPAAMLLFPSWGWSISAWKARVAAGLCVIVPGAAFWWRASGGDYLGWFFHLHHALANRMVHIAENAGLGLGLFAPFLLLFVAAVWVIQDRGDFPVEPTTRGHARRYAPVALLLLAAWFSLPNMVRYMDSIVSLGLVACWMVGADALQKTVLSRRWKTFLALACVIGLFWTGVTLATHHRAIPDLKIPNAVAGQRILTMFSSDTYDALYENPSLQVAPAFEIGFSEPDVQRASANLREGRVSCTWLHQNRVNWVVFPPVATIEPQRNACLRLIRITKRRSLWQVMPEP